MFSSSTSPRLTYHWWRSAPIRIDVVLLKFLRANLQSHHKKVLLTARIPAQRKKMHITATVWSTYVYIHTLFPSVSNLALSHRQQSRMHEQGTIGNPCTQTSLATLVLTGLFARSPFAVSASLENSGKGGSLRQVQCHKAVSTICVCTIAPSIQYQL